MTQQATIAEAARQLGVSQDTVRRRIRRGHLSAHKQVTPKGRAWLVDVPAATTGQAADALEEIRRLQEEVRHWRELAAVLGQEVAARRREVQDLLMLLDRAQDRLFPSSESEPEGMLMRESSPAGESHRRATG